MSKVYCAGHRVSVRSEVADVFISKGLPVHMYCADTPEDVQFCIDKGAALTTANDSTALLQALKK